MSLMDHKKHGYHIKKEEKQVLQVEDIHNTDFNFKGMYKEWNDVQNMSG